VPGSLYTWPGIGRPTWQDVPDMQDFCIPLQHIILFSLVACTPKITGIMEVHQYHLAGWTRNVRTYSSVAPIILYIEFPQQLLDFCSTYHYSPSVVCATGINGIM